VRKGVSINKKNLYAIFKKGGYSGYTALSQGLAVVTKVVTKVVTEVVTDG
jgi:hypothetical protein